MVNEDEIKEAHASFDARIEKIRKALLEREIGLKQTIKHSRYYTYGSLLIAASCVGLVWYMLPLKQTQPVLAIIDGTNGIVKDVQYMKPDSKITQHQGLIRSYVYSYITGRYGYAFAGNIKNLVERYRAVMIFTGSDLTPALKAEVTTSNPDSPYAIYGEKGTIDVKINNVSFFSEDRVKVDFTTNATTADGVSRVFSFTATGKYAFDIYEGLSLEDRYVNPFGFRFVEWSVTQNSSNGNTITQNNQESAVSVSQAVQPTVTATDTAQPKDSASNEVVQPLSSQLPPDNANQKK